MIQMEMGLPMLKKKALGTDKNNEDSDGDGQSDKFESDNGSNPLNEYSKGYEWKYIVGQCENGLLEPTDPSSEVTSCGYVDRDPVDGIPDVDENGDEIIECFPRPIYAAFDVINGSIWSR